MKYHTPGPWKAIAAVTPADGSYQLAGDEPAREIGILLPPVVSSPAEREANIRLIAAAPDLLAAAAWVWMVRGHPADEASALLALKAAIDKATV